MKFLVYKKCGRLALVGWALFAACLTLLCLIAACKGKQGTDVVVVRFLLLPSTSPVGDAIVKLETYPVKTDGGKIIVPATITTIDTDKYREYLQDSHIFQVLIVPTEADIPPRLKGGKTYATLPCSRAPAPCVALITPWATTDERRAADLVLQQLTPDSNSK